MTKAPSPLFTAGREYREELGTYVTPDHNARWEALFALEFEPRCLNEMIQLGSHERMPLIEHWFGQGVLAPDQLNQLLADSWASVEGIGGYGEIVWEMLEFAGFITDAPDAEPLPDPVTLYRGTGPGGERGHSWTTDFNTAAWFALRFHDPEKEIDTTNVVCQVDVPASAILGRFNGRSEHEVVVHPDFLATAEIEIIPVTDERVIEGQRQILADRQTP